MPSCRLLLPLFVVALMPSSSLMAQSPAIVEFFALGKLQQGFPLVDYAHEMVVIGRDGWMHSLDPRDPKAQVRHLEGTFAPASVAELRNELRGEFGPKFEVQATQNFLVVQPRGRGNRWPRLFEDSHRSFVSYMSRRGVRVREGRFPMVAIVFPDQAAMYDEFERLKLDVSRVAGLYSGDSNRVMTHDGGRLETIAATVRHEAAHQSAFNSGVHSRVNDTPRWISEGIGQMFEPAAMANSLSTASLRERLNRDSLRYLDARLSGQNSSEFDSAVVQLVSDDSLFQHPKTVDKAYAVSWAMMFYLAERQQQEFAQLLNHTARRPPFQDYKRIDRIDDFQKIVGCELHEFSRRVRWFLDSQR